MYLFKKNCNSCTENEWEENEAGGWEANWRLLQYSPRRDDKGLNQVSGSTYKWLREVTPLGLILLYSHIPHHNLEFCVRGQSRQEGEMYHWR